MFVELHILQNFAPSNLNRDDTNAPKDCEFGGYRRARISSQCLKRAIRWNDEFRRVLLGCGFATRTKWQANAIADEIRVVRGLPDDDKTALAVARFVIRRAGFKEKGDKTTVLLFLGQDEIDAVVKKINDHWIVIRNGKRPQIVSKNLSGIRTKPVSLTVRIGWLDYPWTTSVAVSQPLQILRKLTQ